MSLRTPITLVVLLVVLMGAAYYGWKTVIEPATGDDKPTTSTHKPTGHKSTCTHTKTYKKGLQVKAKDFLVNVYNAGSRSGLAGDTMDALHAKGFKSGQVTNAPAGVTASNVTILTTNKNLPQIKLVASQFKGPIKYVDTASIAPGVDVIVGDEFLGIDPTAKKKLVLHHTVKVCTDIKS